MKLSGVEISEEELKKQLEAQGYKVQAPPLTEKIWIQVQARKRFPTGTLVVETMPRGHEYAIDSTVPTISDELIQAYANLYEVTQRLKMQYRYSHTERTITINDKLAEEILIATDQVMVIKERGGR